MTETDESSVETYKSLRKDGWRPYGGKKRVNDSFRVQLSRPAEAAWDNSLDIKTLYLTREQCNDVNQFEAENRRRNEIEHIGKEAYERRERKRNEEMAHRAEMLTCDGCGRSYMRVAAEWHEGAELTLCGNCHDARKEES